MARLFALTSGERVSFYCRLDNCATSLSTLACEMQQRNSGEPAPKLPAASSRVPVELAGSQLWFGQAGGRSDARESLA